VQYADLPQPQVHLLFGKYIGSGVAVALAVGIVALCWRARRDSAHSERFMLVTPFILAAGLMLSPIWHIYDDVLILPAILLGFHWRDEYFHLKPFGRAVIVFSIFVLAWSWISAIVLYGVSWVSPISAPTLVFLPFYSLAFSPVCAVASLILLAWERLSRAGPDRSIADASY
jgi:hypothetical protein